MENLTLRQDNADAKVDQLTTQLKELANEMAKQKASIQALQAGEESEGFVEPNVKKAKFATTGRASQSAASSGNSGAQLDRPMLDSYNDKMLWFRGFPHDLQAEIMKAHSATMLQKLMPSMEASQVTFRARNLSRQYSLEFSTKAQAICFKEKVAELGIDWHNLRTKTDVVLKCQVDKSLSGRITDSVLYSVYPLVEKHLKDLGKMKPNMKMGNTGRPRKFFVADENGEAFVFFTIKVDQNKQATMEAHYEEMEHFGITKAVADAIIGEAVENTMSRRAS